MASPISEERSDLPSPKRQKMEATTYDDDDSDSSEGGTPEEIQSDLESPVYKRIEPTYTDDYYLDDSADGTREEIQLFYDEWNKSQGFEIDFSKLTYCSIWKPVDLDDDTWCDEPETNRDLITRLARAAVTKRNAVKGTNLELGKVLRANFHLSAGLTFYISFEVNDPSESDGNQTKPYRAVVRHLAGYIKVYSCYPKPSS